MPDETPNFSSTPLEEKPKKKRTYRRKSMPSGLSAANKREINKNLTSIYSEGGHIPDMRKIKVRKSGSFFKSLVIIIIFGGLLAAVAWSGFFALPGKNETGESNVIIQISGPEKVTVGADNTYNISYENKENTRLNNVVLSVKYPENFAFTDSSVPADNPGHTEWNIGTVSPRQKGNITITGKTYGSLNQEGSWRVFLNYKPENFNSELQKMAMLSVNIDQSPFSMAVNGTKQATVGNEAKYTFTIINNGEWWPDKLELVPNWPNNFYITSSTPGLSKNNKWIITADSIKNMTSDELVGAVEFEVEGKWSDGGEEATTTIIAADLILPRNEEKYKIADALLNIELIKNTVNLSLAINGSLKEIFSQPGDILNITLGLKNTSQMDINKAAVKINFVAPSVNRQSVIDWGQIIDEHDGDLQGKQLSDTTRQGQLTWNSTKIKELAKLKPGQELNVDVTLPIKDIDGLDWTKVDDYKISVVADVAFTDSNGEKQLLSSNPLDITLNSDLKFETRDAVSANEQGKEVHDIDWVLTNNFHPLKNIKITADVFGDITFLAPEQSPAGEFNFNDAENKISWSIPEMPESVDVLAQSFSITMNTKNPTQNMLVSKVRVQAEDVITGQTLDLMGNEIILK